MTRISRKTVKIVLPAFLLLVIIAGAFAFRPLLFRAQAYFLVRGINDLNNGDLPAAETNFKIAKFIDSKSPRAYAWLGKIYVITSQYELAESNLSKAIDLGLKQRDAQLYSDTVYNLAFSNEILARYEKSAPLYQEHIALHPGSPLWSYYRLANVYLYRLNKPREAISLLEDLISNGLNLHARFNDANKAAAYTLLGRSYLFFKEYDKAVSAFNKSLELNSGESFSAWAANLDLALIFSTTGNLNQALKHINKAEEIRPDDLVAECYRANVYSDVNDYQKAIETAESALNQGVRDTICLSVLGKAYSAVGRKTEAKTIFQEIINSIESLDYKSAYENRRLEKFKEMLKML